MTIGVLGGGQLGRMLALAAARLGLRLRFMDESPSAVAGHVGELIVDSFADPRRLDEFAAGLALVTYEFENVPVGLAEALSRRLNVLPGVAALRVSQDRLLEKTLFRELGIPTPASAPVDSLDDLRAALATLGTPAVLKTRRLGYDGKGQAVLRSTAEIEQAYRSVRGVPSGLERGESVEAAADGGGQSSAALILEAYVPFQRELSIIAVRSITGQTAFYPLACNEHRGGVLRVSRAPALGVSAGMEQQAQNYAQAVMDRLGYVGVLTIEFFEHDGRLIANEMAPRVHNSGHWTIDGARTSQFENHLRAILGWPLGSTEPLGHAGMVNLLGDHPPAEQLLEIPEACVHLYGKAARPGRKLGHINVLAATPDDRDAAVARVARAAGTV